MKTALLLLPLLAAPMLLFSQSKKNKPLNYYAGASFAVEQSALSIEKDLAWLLLDYDTRLAHRAGPGYSVQGHAGMRIAGGLFATGALGFSQRSIVQTRGAGVWYCADPRLVGNETPNAVERRVYVNSVDLTLAPQYELAFGSFRIFAQSGLQAQFYLDKYSRTQVFFPTAETQVHPSNEAAIDRGRSLNIAWVSALGIAWQPVKQYTLTLAPTFRLSLGQDAMLTDYSLTRLYSMGVQAGVARWF